MASTLDLLKRLNDNGVAYVVVGGLAGVAHGSGLVTEDVDVCAPLDRENLVRIWAALDGLNPRWRMSPEQPRPPDSPDSLVGYKNLYLITDLGQIDFLSEITGVGPYEDVSRCSISVDLGGVVCRVLDLDTLIHSKRAMGRPKDHQAAIELEALRDRIRCRQDEGEAG
jgi:hypothetical protein